MKKPAETQDTPETTGFDLVTNTERSIEGIVEERLRLEGQFVKAFKAGTFKHVTTGFQNPYEIEKWWNNELTQTLQTERQKMQEAVEAKAIEVREEEANAYNKIIEESVKAERERCLEIADRIISRRWPGIERCPLDPLGQCEKCRGRAEFHYQLKKAINPK
jgi:hypothetical protein